jgi:hypothetical protein
MNVRDMKEEPKTSPAQQKKLKTDADDVKKTLSLLNL